MSFSDLLTSSRGPGVIGTFLALFVLVGFGTLYMFVFDEGLQGGQKKIEAVIRDQGMMIETYKTQIEDSKNRIEKAKRLKEVAKEAGDLKLRVDNAVKRLAELREAKKAAEAAVAAADEAWAKYRDEYRASEWAAAEGEELGDITTVSGRKYEKVKIRKVDHLGIQIIDTTGPKAIASEELPPELQDRFQFDEEIKRKVVSEGERNLGILSDNVEIAALNEKIAAKNASAQDLAKQIETANAAIQTATANKARFEAAIARKRSEIAAERTKAVSRAPQMQEELRALERQAEQSLKSIPANEVKVREATTAAAALNREIEALEADKAAIIQKLNAKAPASP